MLLASVNKCFISIYLCQHVSLTFFQTSLSSVNSGIKDTHMYNKSYVYKGLCNTNCYMRQYFLVLHRQLDVDSTTALMLCVCVCDSGNKRLFWAICWQWLSLGVGFTGHYASEFYISVVNKFFKKCMTFNKICILKKITFWSNSFLWLCMF